MYRRLKNNRLKSKSEWMREERTAWREKVGKEPTTALKRNVDDSAEREEWS